ncbi:hypothetical protein [Alcanivorax sp. 24]|uniref:hypothetical protein n=1 Tax=Alcanivoracaceae TaxID=224372 RepID=UPI00105BB3C1|nr:hypothetical protein [Alcanivorax sp. 24]
MIVSKKVISIFFVICFFLVLGVEIYSFEAWPPLLGKSVLVAFSCYQVAAFLLKMDVVSAFGRMVSYSNENRTERLFYMVLYGSVLIYLVMLSVMKVVG